METKETKLHITDYLSSLTDAAIRRSVRAFLQWQKTGKWEDISSEVHVVADLYFYPMHGKGISSILASYNSITAELAKRWVDEDSLMDKQKKKHANAYSYWSEEDDKIIFSYMENGSAYAKEGIEELAKSLSRNDGAIRSRIRKLTLLLNLKTPEDKL